MTTFTGQVSQSSDDATSTNSSTDAVLTTAEVNFAGKTGTAQFEWCGFRWQNVTIPATATISACTFSPYFVSTTNTGAVDVWLQSATNPATFTTSAIIASYSRIGSATSWTPGTLGSVGFNPSPDLSSNFTTLIGTGGWASGNAVSVITEGQGTTGQTSNIYMYDQSSSDGAELNITYTTPNSGIETVPLSLYGAGVNVPVALFGQANPSPIAITG